MCNSMTIRYQWETKGGEKHLNLPIAIYPVAKERELLRKVPQKPPGTYLILPLGKRQVYIPASHLFPSASCRNADHTVGNYLGNRPGHAHVLACM